jgi:alkaline phosphatase D
VGNPAFFHPRAAIPAVLADTFDAGRTANGGNPPATVLGIPNPRIDSPPGTMLGGPQKAWFKATMVASTATWRLWASSLPMLRLRVNQGSVATLLADRYATTDSWDGYNTERTELLTFLRDGGVRNTVVLSGDLHAQFASVLMDDFNAPTPTPVAVEFTAAGVCSNSLFSFFEFASRGLPGGVREIVTYDSVPLGGDEGFVPNLNTLLYYGTESALAASVTHDLATIEAAADTPNPHMAYCDTDSQGFGVLTVTETDVTARLVTMNRPIADAVDGSGVKTTATFTVAAQGAGEEPALQGPVLTGEPPFPFTAT